MLDLELRERRPLDLPSTSGGLRQDPSALKEAVENVDVGRLRQEDPSFDRFANYIEKHVQGLAVDMSEPTST